MEMNEGGLRARLGKVSPQARYAFFSAVVCGLLAHGMALFNKFSWHDDLYYLFDVGATVSSGRWTLHLLYWLENLFFQDGHFSMPLFNGGIAILCVGAATALIVRMLRIRSRFLSAALGCLMVTLPTLTGLFTYVFTIHYYMAAMLGMTLSAYLLCEKRGWMPKAAALLTGAAAMGIYQAFLPLALGLILLDSIRKLAEGEMASAGRFWREKGIQALCLVGILGLYLLANRVFQLRLGMVQVTYPGMESAGTVSDYLSRVGRAYQEFFLPTRNVDWDMYPFRAYTMYQLMLLGDLVLSVLLAARTIREDKGRGLTLSLLLALIPLAGNFIFIMADHVHGLMNYGQITQMALFIWLMDRQSLRPPRLRRVVSAAAAVVLSCTGLLYIRQANQCYLKINFEQQEAISFFTTLVTQIKSSEDYRADRPVLFLHELEIVDPTVTHLEELDTVRTLSYEFNTLEYLNNYTWARFMEVWCGFTPVYYAGEDLSDLPEVRAMPHYPDAGSIRLVHDVLVVNF